MSQVRKDGIQASLTLPSRSGIAVIPTPTSLMRLNYFDGKFLRAEDLQLEQRSQRNLVELSNRAGGSGVVHGYSLNLSGSGDQLDIEGGLAIDALGRVLLLPQLQSVNIQELIERSAQKSRVGQGAVQLGSAKFGDCELRSEADSSPLQESSAFYVITIGHAEAYCGEEDVYGKLCEEACVTSIERPYILEGVVIRAIPIQFDTAFAKSSAIDLNSSHLRSLVASVYFADERRPDLIFADGLASSAWCRGALADGNQDVPIGLIARSGQSTLFLDAWTARRERMEAPPRHHWAWQMSMRPWNVFLAQVLQFQCQLRHCLSISGPGGDEDPCQDAYGAIGEASQQVDEVISFYAKVATRLAAMDSSVGNSMQSGLNDLKNIQSRLESAKLGSLGPRKQFLIGCGIIELPSAGYLPVVPGSTVSVNTQVRRMMGEGVDLRFCAVRPDYVAHALEEAQHMDRISLLQGLDNPKEKPRVDVLVPDGEIEVRQQLPTGQGYEMSLTMLPAAISLLLHWTNPQQPTTGAELLRRLGQAGLEFKFEGAARGARSDSGGIAFHFAGLAPFNIPNRPPAFTLIEVLRNAALWVSMEIDRDPFAMNRHESTRVYGEFTMLFRLAQGFVLKQARLVCDLQVKQQVNRSANAEVVQAVLTGSVDLQSAGVGAVNASIPSIRISETVNLKRQVQDSAAATVEIELPKPGLLGEAQSLARFHAIRNWTSASSAQVGGKLRLHKKALPPLAPAFTILPVAGGSEIGVFTASQTVNPNALKPGSQPHESAVTALRVIASALKDPQFDDLAIRKLFPPPKPDSGELIINARNDWVLFHRRRDKQCAPAEPPVVVIGSRRYRLYFVDLGGLKNRDTLSAALQANDGGAIDSFEPSPVNVVEFAAGTQALETAPEIVRADWKPLQVGSGEIAYAAVASGGEALDEGPALARARLSSLSDTLDRVTPLRADAMLELIPNIPDASTQITAHPYDGVMIVGVVPTATQCNVVYRVDAAQFKRIITSIPLTVPDNVHNLITKAGGQELGIASFADGTASFASDPQSIIDAWNQSGGGDLIQAASVSRRPGDPVTPEAKTLIDLFRDQATAISIQIAGTSPEPAIVHPEEQGELPRCPAITLLAHRPRVTGPQFTGHTIFRSRDVMGQQEFKVLSNNIQSSGVIPRALVDRRVDFESVDVEPATGNVTNESSARFRARFANDFSAHDDVTELNFISISRPGSSENDRKQDQETSLQLRKEALQTKADANLKVGIANGVFNGSAEIFPANLSSQVKAMTLILEVKPG